MRTKTDILVAGGGVAGLVATAVFAAEGFRVVCVDPLPPARDRSDPTSDLRSTAFLMPSVRLLQSVGIWAALEPHAAPLKVMRIADAGGPEPRVRETADFVATEIGEETFGFNVPNWKLRGEILGRLEGAENVAVKLGVRVAHVTARTTRCLVRLSDGSTVETDLLVAADGRDSSVREALGIGVRRWSYGQKAIVFAVRHAQPHEDVSTEVHRTGGPFTLVPLAGGEAGQRSAVVWMEDGPRAVELAGLDDAAFEREANIRSCGVLGPLSVESERRVWPIVTQVAHRLHAPRTALIAEAAHVVPPIGAQGLNMSLRDIAALRDLCREARAAGTDIGSTSLLARYHRLRYPDILVHAAGIDALNRAAMAGSRQIRDLRRAGLQLIAGLRPVRSTAMSLGLGAGRSGGAGA
jgi:2-octaprenyl-6-methoxyphenol hydroxylase